MKQILEDRIPRKVAKPLSFAMVCLTLIIASVVKAADDSMLTLNFRDAELSALIEFVAEETERNFLVDPRVRGRVTLVSGAPVHRDALYEIFLSVLQIYGFVAIENQGVVRILPDALARQASSQVGSDPRSSPDAAHITHVVSLQHVDAGQLVAILRPLMPQNAHLAAISEANALVFSDSAGNVSRMIDLIRRIDTQTQEDTEVIVVEFASASDLVRIITELENAEGRTRPTSRRLRLIADERSNSILVSGDPDRRVAARALIGHLDLPVQGGNTQVIYLRYADAREVADVLQSLMVGGADNSRSDEAVLVQPHQATNALVLRAPQGALQDMRNIIRQLDVRRAQVLVEAVIAEVTTETARELGVQWFAGSENHGIGLVNFGAAEPSLVGIARGFIAGDLSSVRVGDGLSVAGFGDRGGVTIGALIRALAQDASTNILSTPSVLTLDNEESEIIVGQNVPFRSGRAIEQSGQAFDTIQRQDIGVKLVVRPQINEGNAVKLSIEQEVSQIAPRVEAAADLITNTRKLRTSVMVDDGQIIVLGGLIDDAVLNAESRVPGLGRIPGLGRLFRYESETVRKVNLMVFLRPVIVRDRTSQVQLSAQRYQLMQAWQRQANAVSGSSGRYGEMPTLPDMDHILDLPPPFRSLTTGTEAVRIQPPPSRP